MSHLTISIVLVVSLSLLQMCPANGYQRTRHNNKIHDLPSSAPVAATQASSAKHVSTAPPPTSLKLSSSGADAKQASSQSTLSASAVPHTSTASAWQTMSSPQQHNWIILPADKHRRRTNENVKLPYTSPYQRHPVNYYAYKGNNITGNYETLKAWPHPSATTSYVMSIRNLRHTEPNHNAAATNELYSLGEAGRHMPSNHRNAFQFTANDEDYRANKLQQHNEPNQQRQHERSTTHLRQKQSNRDNIVDNVRLTGMAQTSEDKKKQTPVEVFEPLRNVLDNVQLFCKVFEHIISNEDEKDFDNDNDVDTDGDGEDDFLANYIDGVDVDRRPLKVDHAFARSIAASGRKVKKLKKKLKKFILPLLIAYKLKFLTLIPVLIGGLTLLVGTTGLAGFFFALFTAVMSLKSSSGHKSIVVK